MANQTAKITIKNSKKTLKTMTHFFKGKFRYESNHYITIFKRFDLRSFDQWYRSDLRDYLDNELIFAFVPRTFDDKFVNKYHGYVLALCRVRVTYSGERILCLSERDSFLIQRPIGAEKCIQETNMYGCLILSKADVEEAAQCQQ